jgi:hypothetical protein
MWLNSVSLPLRGANSSEGLTQRAAETNLSCAAGPMKDPPGEPYGSYPKKARGLHKKFSAESGAIEPPSESELLYRESA